MANISVHGRRLNLSVSVGVSNSPADGVSSAGALIELAGSRLKTAQQSGGNRVIACDASASGLDPVTAAAPTLDRAVALIRSGEESALKPFLPELGSQVLPLLSFLERELSLGFPLDSIEKYLAGRRRLAANESTTVVESEEASTREVSKRVD